MNTPILELDDEKYEFSHFGPIGSSGAVAIVSGYLSFIRGVHGNWAIFKKVKPKSPFTSSQAYIDSKFRNCHLQVQHHGRCLFLTGFHDDKVSGVELDPEALKHLCDDIDLHLKSIEE